jgi:hypothetical protein
LPVGFVERFVADFVSLLSVTAAERNITSTIGVRLDLLRGDDQPFAAVDVERVGNYTLNTLHQPPWTRTVRRPIPVVGEVAPPLTSPQLVEAAALMAGDVLNQFGVSKLQLLRQET